MAAEGRPIPLWSKYVPEGVSSSLDLSPRHGSFPEQVERAAQWLEASFEVRLARWRAKLSPASPVPPRP